MNKATGRRAVVVAVAGLIAWAAVAAFANRYRVAFDTQPTRCLPWRVYLVDLRDRAPRRFALMAFRTKGVVPFRDGTIFSKFVAALPGDEIDVRPMSTRIAGIEWGPLRRDYADFLHRPLEAFVRTERVPPGFVAMMTSAPTSYDSRYWDLLPTSQIEGRAVPLW